MALLCENLNVDGKMQLGRRQGHRRFVFTYDDGDRLRALLPGGRHGHGERRAPAAAARRDPGRPIHPVNNDPVRDHRDRVVDRAAGAHRSATASAGRRRFFLRYGPWPDVALQTRGARRKSS